jgi:hypothetical protein
MATESDRSLIKLKDEGTVLGNNLAQPREAVANCHSVTHQQRRDATDSAANGAIANTVAAVLYRDARLKKASWAGDANVANSTSDYVLFKAYAVESGGSARLIAQGNTANGAITRYVAWPLDVVATSGANKVLANHAAPAVIMWEATKAGSGKFVNTGTLALEFEHV